MRHREVKPTDPRFRLQRGQEWHRGARVSKRNTMKGGRR